MSGFSSERCFQCDREDWPPSKTPRRWRPPTDVYETDDHVIIKVEIAGIKTDDFTITFAGRRLVISGCRYDQSDKLSYQNMEISYGEFHTEVLVNWPIKESDVEALYEAGFLYVRLPKHGHEVKIPIKKNHAE